MYCQPDRVTWPPPLCDPATSGGGRARHRRLDSGPQSVLHRQQLRRRGHNEGSWTVYGSIQQDARGPVAPGGWKRHTGYRSTYMWDPRLPLYSPPFYLTPGTPSWTLDLLGRDLYRACVTELPVRPRVHSRPMLVATRSRPTHRPSAPPTDPPHRVAAAARRVLERAGTGIRRARPERKDVARTFERVVPSSLSRGARWPSPRRLLIPASTSCASLPHQPLLTLIPCPS